MRNSLNKHLGRLEQLEDNLSVALSEKRELDELTVATQDAQIILQKAASLSQSALASHLSNIVTHALQATLNKPYVFVCEFVERRGTTEADFYLEKDGNQYDLLTGTGGGVADVVSFALKVAYLLLSNSSRVLVIDEVSRHVNSVQQRENFASVLKQLSAEFDIQLILTTALPELIAVADKVVTLVNENDIAEVR